MGLFREILTSKLWAVCSSALRMFFIFAGCIQIYSASNATQSFEEANRFYEERKYPKAIAAYQTLVTNGKVSAEIFFNLGNAYFKNGDIGRAILNYLKAERLDPRDPDIQANLRFARDSISGSISYPQNILDRAATILTLNELAILTAILFWAWFILLTIRQVRPASRASLRPLTNLFGVLLFGFIVWLGFAWVHSREETAIVVAREAIIRLGPLDESQTAFTASDGTELKLLGQRENWAQVSDRQNRVGWVKTGPVIIFPENHPHPKS